MVVVVRGIPVVVGADIREGRYIVYLSPDSILEKYGEAISFTSEAEALYEGVRYVNMLGEEEIIRLREENIKYGFRGYNL